MCLASTGVHGPACNRALTAHETRTSCTAPQSLHGCAQTVAATKRRRPGSPTRVGSLLRELGGGSTASALLLTRPASPAHCCWLSALGLTLHRSQLPSGLSGAMRAQRPFLRSAPCSTAAARPPRCQRVSYGCGWSRPALLVPAAGGARVPVAARAASEGCSSTAPASRAQERAAWRAQESARQDSLIKDPFAPFLVTEVSSRYPRMQAAACSDD